MKQVILYEREDSEAIQVGPINYDQKLIQSNDLQKILEVFNNSLDKDINELLEYGDFDDGENNLPPTLQEIKEYLLTIDLSNLESLIDSAKLGDTISIATIDFDEYGCPWSGIKEYYILIIE